MLTELHTLGELLEDNCVEGLFTGLDVCTFDVVDTNDAETGGEFEVEIVVVVVGLLLSEVWIDGVGFVDVDGLPLLDGTWLGLSELD